MNNRSTLMKNVATALSVLALIFGLMFVAEIGISDTADIIISGGEGVAVETNATFGGSVGFLDRAVVTGMTIGIIGPAGLGLYATSRKDPEALQTLEKHSGWLVAAVGVIGFWSVVTSVLQGDYDWNAHSNALNAFNGFVACATAVGIMQFLGLKKN